MNVSITWQKQAQLICLFISHIILMYFPLSAIGEWFYKTAVCVIVEFKLCRWETCSKQSRAHRFYSLDRDSADYFEWFLAHSNCVVELARKYKHVRSSSDGKGVLHLIYQECPGAKTWPHSNCTKCSAKKIVSLRGHPTFRLFIHSTSEYRVIHWL